MADINECSNASLHNCTLNKPGVTCINSIGGYSCGCKEGYTKDIITGVCNGIYVKVCGTIHNTYI